ncbi:hypothetical protein P700755_002817 [Psychroflexus torquis ATCC 700755]|uniref:Uncharacterized protein n=1 Tax=Psychroflexus torquis (strain ATCC 700755 / CIP 106069 / ACAM 623) TaxID=313595 RepID=K4IVQ9_PSYTT|nr:hypothetical protein [Psychroflexus torquis]AFU69535.1 hypothetical protein P700755_002817 [Psychroflexus torquis ATCC 700755]
MGHIAEPKGVDFLIKSTPLTDKEREELSEHIKKRKIELGKKSEPKLRPLTKESRKHNNV